MGRIEYRKGDMLKDPPKGVFLLHSCNTKGVWGPYIAQQFKQKWPEAYEQYRDLCLNTGMSAGDACIVAEDADHPIICLFTSVGHGLNVDPPEEILKATRDALNELPLEELGEIEIHSPKINSGKFKTPWEATEAIIEEVLKKNPLVKWVVWDL